MDSREFFNKNNITHLSKGEDQLLCATGCGFFGNSATHNLCSQCYNHYLKEQSTKLAARLEVAKPSPPVSSENSGNPFPWTVNHQSAAIPTPTPDQKNKCKCCNKVGLTGFACRCGGTFCGLHRYPEEHSCTFDFKTAARVALAKENPLCIADKLQSRI